VSKRAQPVRKKEIFFFAVVMGVLTIALMVGPIRRVIEGSGTFGSETRLVIGCVILAMAVALAVLTRPSKWNGGRHGEKETR
jgi:hypothetical protein